MFGQIFENQKILKILTIFQTILIVALIAFSINLWNSFNTIKNELEITNEKIQTIDNLDERILLTEAYVDSNIFRITKIENSVNDFDKIELEILSSIQDIENSLTRIYPRLVEIELSLYTIDKSLEKTRSCIEEISDYLERIDNNYSRIPNWYFIDPGC